jgi:hypothetical protein
MRTIAASLSLLFGLLAAPFALTACTDAEKCTRGEVGCACTESNSCKSGAVCNNEMCVARNSAGSGGGSGSGGSASDVECSDDSFAEACQGFCDALCANQDDLCLNSACEEGNCGQAACEEACDDDTDCMVRACEAQLEMTCETFGAEHPGTGVFKSFCFDNDPTCAVGEDGCSDTCGKLSSRTGGDLSGNKMCEDGGKGAVTGTAACLRGTDCTDCGMRMCAVTLEQCSRNGDCCGFSEGESFCVKTGETSRVCLTACSPTMLCEGGELCTPLSMGSDMVCVP